jgi:hypothetical protein
MKNIKKYNLILILTALILIACTLIFLMQIHQSNKKVINICEERTYVDWTKYVEKTLTQDDINSLQKEIALKQNELERCKNNTKTYTEDGLIRLCSIINSVNKIMIDTDQNYLNQGFKLEVVPDDERRIWSKKEVKNYQNCLKEQKEAKLKIPEKYKFLFIGDGIILIVGLLVFFAIKEK